MATSKLIVMETKKKSFERVGIVAGLVTAVILVAYFLVMRALHLLQIPELRYLNYVILLAALFIAYRYYRRSNENIDYLPGLGLGIVTSAASMVPFAGFLYVYFTHIEPHLFGQLQVGISNGFMEYITPFSLGGAIIMEGMGIGLIMSFILMQYYKSKESRSDEPTDPFTPDSTQP